MKNKKIKSSYFITAKKKINNIIMMLNRFFFISLKKRQIEIATKPIKNDFGFSLGTPIDRFYINDFLRENSNDIKGIVLEISENTYTQKFGSNVLTSEILSYQPSSSPNIIIGDLTDKLSLPTERYDCFICTQTLNFVFEIQNAIEGIYKLLKTDGVALVTIAGLTQVSRYDMDRWGDYWRLTTRSAEKLFENIFGKDNVTVSFYGNPLAACYLLQGIPAEQIDETAIHTKHPDYQIVISVVAKKARLKQ